MRVRWLRNALRNLEQAHDYIAKSDPDAALNLVVKIQAVVEQLTEFPKMGRAGRVKGTRELVVAHTPYILVYRIQGNTVEILRVLHSSRQYPG